MAAKRHRAEDIHQALNTLPACPWKDRSLRHLRKKAAPSEANRLARNPRQAIGANEAHSHATSGTSEGRRVCVRQKSFFLRQIPLESDPAAERRNPGHSDRTQPARGASWLILSDSGVGGRTTPFAVCDSTRQLATLEIT